MARCFYIVQENKRYFDTGSYASKKFIFGRFRGIFCTKKLIYRIKIPSLKIELSFVVQLLSL
jgi:hypothetical protein